VLLLLVVHGALGLSTGESVSARHITLNGCHRWRGAARPLWKEHVALLAAMALILLCEGLQPVGAATKACGCS
jgi:hypothetical protein